MEHFRVTWHSFFLSLTLILHNLVSHPEQVFVFIPTGTEKFKPANLCR